MRRFRFASARSALGYWSATQSGASSVGPSEHVGGKIDRRVYSLKARRSAFALAGHSHIGPFGGPDNQFCRVLNRPWSKIVPCNSVPGIGRRSGSKPPLRVSRAQRWLGRDRERRRSLRLGRFRRCTGRLNATQPGVLAVSTSYIRGLPARCKGASRGVATRQHLSLFALGPLRLD